MSTFYDNLPLPIFLALTFLVPILILMYFYSKRDENPYTFLIGMLFLCLTGFSAGVVRIFIEFKIFEESLHWFGAIPIPFILMTAFFVLVGAYKKSKDDEEKRRKIIYLSIIQLCIVLFIVLLGIFKPWE